MNFKPLETEKNIFVAERLFEVNSGQIINWLRLVSVIIFAAVEMLNYHYFQVVNLDFHQTVLSILGLWSVLTIGLFLFNFCKVSKPWFKWITSVVDVFLLTMVLWIADGAKSPLTPLFLVLILISALHFNLKYLWFNIGLNLTGYLATTYYSSVYRKEFSVDHSKIVIFLSILIITGAITGQIVRTFRKLVLSGDVRHV